jgi:hypothetical protein
MFFRLIKRFTTRPPADAGSTRGRYTHAPPPLLGACRHGIRSSIPVAKLPAVCKWAPHLLPKILFGWAGRGARISAAACTAVGCVFGAVRDNEGNGLGEGDSEGDGEGREGGSEGDGVMAGGVSGGPVLGSGLWKRQQQGSIFRSENDIYSPPF